MKASLRPQLVNADRRDGASSNTKNVIRYTPKWLDENRVFMAIAMMKIVVQDHVLIRIGLNPSANRAYGKYICS